MPKQLASQLRREKHAGSWPTAATQYALYTVAAVLRIDLYVASVGSLTTPMTTSAQAPSAPEQNFTSGQSSQIGIFSRFSCRIITQVTLEGFRSVTRHLLHASICSRSPEHNLQFEKPFHGQSRFVDSRASTSESQTCSLLLPPGEWLGPFIMGCAGVRYLMQTPTRNVSDDRNAQDCNESEATSLKARERATQTKSVCGRDLAPNQDTWEKLVLLSVESIRGRHKATHPTNEKGLVHLRTILFRYAVLGDFNMVVSNHHVNVKATTHCSGHGRDERKN